MKIAETVELNPFLRAVYTELEKVWMSQTDSLINSMASHVYCIDVERKEAYFVQVGTDRYFHALQHQWPVYSISEIIQKYAH